LLRRARPARAQTYAREVLALTGLEERAALRFAALDDLERKLLELARALATEPQLLLLDDLAAGLDAAGGAAIGTLLAAVRERGITIVAAARTLDRIPAVADSVVAIEGGKTSEIKSHAAADVHA
jgi:branched-chain amino acid transport system ATP-binding protein